MYRRGVILCFRERCHLEELGRHCHPEAFGLHYLPGEGLEDA